MESESVICAPDLPGSESNADRSELLLQFVKIFKELPELWDPNHPKYKNKFRRNFLLDKLLNIYVHIRPGSTRADVRRKINTLRTNYRKELKKIEEAKSLGTIYRPTSKVFYALQFLGNSEPINTNCHQRENRWPSIVERSSGNGDEENFKMRTDPTSHQAHEEPSMEIYPPEPLECSVTPHNIIPTVAKAWGEKLQSLDPLQRVFAEKAINDILFEASLGTLQRHSVKINDFQIAL